MERLSSHVIEIIESEAFDVPVHLEETQQMCHQMIPLLLAEPTVLRLDGPLCICGDIHGQLTDFYRVMKMGGCPPFTKWLFLGDYVDRGTNSVEVICLLFALKLRFPRHVYLLRGNHESGEMTEFYGFAHECEEKLDRGTWVQFCRVFDALPLAAVISGKIFCVHGGIGPQLKTISQISKISRPLAIPTTGLITDLLWSDPAQIQEYDSNPRGPTVTWGLEPAQEFMKKNKLTKIVRAHQVAMNGYEFPFAPNESVVTLFSASNYADGYPNKAAFISLSKDLVFDYKLLPEFVVAAKYESSQLLIERRPSVKESTKTEDVMTLAAVKSKRIGRSQPFFLPVSRDSQKHDRSSVPKQKRRP